MPGLLCLSATACNTAPCNPLDGTGTYLYCLGIGSDTVPATPFTQLPDLPPAGEAERHFFTSAACRDWCHDEELADLHQTFQAAGLPYTVQTRPALELDPQDDTSWEDSCLTAQERNPLLFLH